jgi:DNA modification methylase
MREGLHEGDCLEVMRKMADASVDAIVTDPPYGLRFMGKRWDYDVPSVEIWAECLRVLKPGGHLLAFAGTRTQHRMAVRIEDAGFEIRDMIAWVYGSGFPKSLDVSKAIDKKAGAARGTVKVAPRPATSGTMMVGCDTRPWIEKSREVGYHEVADKNAVTDEAKRWQGWGTSLKPSLEPITVARKPLDGSVAENVIAHDVGVLNIDGCRVEMGSEYNPNKMQRQKKSEGSIVGAFGAASLIGKEIPTYKPGGRWPANLIHSGEDEVVALFPTSKSTGGRSVKRSGGGNVGSRKTSEVSWTADDPGYGDEGSAARFFYCAKASRRERGEENAHPTVKPIALMRYLCRLVTPPNGLLLDPFAGTGTTGLAAREEGFRFVGIEMDAQTCEIARRRLR